jgi:sugar porter (SP) family MFS transporter
MACGVYLVVGCASLGGVLFGLDQGNWGGAIVKEPFVESFCEGSYGACRNADDLPDRYVSFLAFGSSLVQFGAALGALTIAPWCALRHGRHQTLFLGCLITIFGNMGQVFTVDKTEFLVYRFVDGFGVGLVTYALPMFVSEVAPTEIRGSLGCMQQITMVFGMVIASLLNCAAWFSYQTSFSLPVYPAAILAAVVFCLPRSPRFAFITWQRRGDTQKGIAQAREALTRLRGSSEIVEKDLLELRAALEGNAEQAPWSAVWRDKSLLRRVAVANMLQWLQQLSGVNAILSYGPAIFKSAGVPLDSLMCTMIVNAINFVFTVIMALVIDYWGRRSLLLISSWGMFVTMTFAACCAYALEQMDGKNPNRPILGWTLLVCVCGYMASFAVGWGAVPWVYPSEIFPMSVKEKALSTSVCSQWIANFLIAFVVPLQVRAFWVSGTFFFYSLCLGCCVFFVYQFVPETKGKSEQEVAELFGSRTLGIKGSMDERQMPLSSADHTSPANRDAELQPASGMQELGLPNRSH